MSLLSITESIQQVAAAVDRFNADLNGNGGGNSLATLQWGNVSLETFERDLGEVPLADRWFTYPLNTQRGDVVLELIDNKFRVIDGTYLVTTVLTFNGQVDIIRSRLIVDGVAADVVGLGDSNQSGGKPVQLTAQGFVTLTESQQLSVEYYTLNGTGKKLVPFMDYYSGIDGVPNVPAMVTLLKIG